MRLYKYFHPDRLDILERAQLRFSPPHAFNDPFDLKPNIQGVFSRDHWNSGFHAALPELVREEYAKLGDDIRSSITFEEFLKLATAKASEMEQIGFFLLQSIDPHIRPAIENKFEELIGILCLTEKPDNLLMWAHYANSHQGFVIEFDSTDNFFNQKRSRDDEFCHVRKVTYSRRRPTRTLSAIESFDFFLVKSMEWEYEQEWRVLTPLKMANDVIKTKPIDIHLFNFPRHIIKSIILGCRISESSKLNIINILKNNKEYDHVNIKQALIDKEEFKINFIEIDRQSL